MVYPEAVDINNQVIFVCQKVVKGFEAGCLNLLRTQITISVSVETAD